MLNPKNAGHCQRYTSGMKSEKPNYIAKLKINFLKELSEKDKNA